MNYFFNPSNGKIYGKNLRWPSLYPGSTSNLNWYTITVEKIYRNLCPQEEGIKKQQKTSTLRGYVLTSYE